MAMINLELVGISEALIFNQTKFQTYQTRPNKKKNLGSKAVLLEWVTGPCVGVLRARSAFRRCVISFGEPW